MAIIKSYTDLEQSKKLAKILPLETADMGYLWNGHSFSEYPVSKQTIFKRIENIPCWSLASLLGVMPQINEWITPYGHKNDKLFQFDPKIYKIWEHSTIPSYKVAYGNELSTDIYDNPVDACVAMVEKLHKLNLL